MDAYIFSEQATSGAISELASGVGGSGPARVVLPISGSHELYVAVAADNNNDLAAKISAVAGTEGLDGVVSSAATRPSGSFAFPTYAAVSALVGFAMLTTGAGLANSVYAAAIEVTGVIGVAIVNVGGVSVLVEATASTQNALDSILDTVAGLTGVVTSVRASGPSSGGTGLPS